MFRKNIFPKLNDLITQHIQETIDESADTEFKITRLRRTLSPVLGRTVLMFFENHEYSDLTLWLVNLVTSKIDVDLIALEQPILRTGYLEANEFGGGADDSLEEDGEADERYTEALECFCEDMQAKNLSVVCVDEQDLMMLPSFDEATEALIEKGNFTGEDEVIDYIRNDVMVNTLYNFTPAKNIVGIFGANHFFDLITKLKDQDTKCVVLPVMMIVDEEKQNAITRTIIETELGKVTLLKVVIKDRQILGESNFLNALIAEINSLKQSQLSNINNNNFSGNSNLSTSIMLNSLQSTVEAKPIDEISSAHVTLSTSSANVISDSGTNELAVVEDEASNDEVGSGSNVIHRNKRQKR